MSKALSESYRTIVLDGNLQYDHGSQQNPIIIGEAVNSNPRSDHCYMESEFKAIETNNKKEGNVFFVDGQLLKGDPSLLHQCESQLDPLLYNGNFYDAFQTAFVEDIEDIDPEKIRSMVSGGGKIRIHMMIRVYKTSEEKVKAKVALNPKFYDLKYGRKLCIHWKYFDLPRKFTLDMFNMNVDKRIEPIAMSALKERTWMFLQLFEEHYKEAFLPINIPDEDADENDEIYSLIRKLGLNSIEANKGVISGRLHDRFIKNNDLVFTVRFIVSGDRGEQLIGEKIFGEITDPEKAAVHWSEGNYDDIKARFEPTESGYMAIIEDA